MWPPDAFRDDGIFAMPPAEHISLGRENQTIHVADALKTSSKEGCGMGILESPATDRDMTPAAGTRQRRKP
jgi:hypothetical protein